MVLILEQSPGGVPFYRDPNDPNRTMSPALYEMTYGASSVPSGNIPAPTTGQVATGESGTLNLTTGSDLMELEFQFTSALQQQQQNHQMRMQEIENAAAAELARMNANLQRELQAGSIASNERVARMQINSSNTQFAKSLALQREEFEHQKQVDLLREAREERLLQAQLAASPADWVAYQFYARQLGTPDSLATADQIDSLGLTAGAEGLDQGAPPAASDESLQTMVSSFFGDTQTAYNPRLSGEGVFGTEILSPNQISRKTFEGFSPTDLDMLSSLLRGGINIDGRRVSINPEDYLSQVQESFVPTLGEALEGQRPNQYIF